jgi:hypothetical protein
MYGRSPEIVSKCSTAAGDAAAVEHKKGLLPDDE